MFLSVYLSLSLLPGVFAYLIDQYALSSSCTSAKLVPASYTPHFSNWQLTACHLLPMPRNQECLSGSKAAWPASRPASIPSCMPINFLSLDNVQPGVRRKHFRRLMCRKFFRQIFHMATRSQCEEQHVFLVPHSASVTVSLLPPHCLELELLISRASETCAAFSSLFNLLLRATLWASDSGVFHFIIHKSESTSIRGRSEKSKAAWVTANGNILNFLHDPLAFLDANRVPRSPVMRVGWLKNTRKLFPSSPLLEIDYTQGRGGRGHRPGTAWVISNGLKELPTIWLKHK